VPACVRRLANVSVTPVFVSERVGFSSVATLCSEELACFVESRDVRILMADMEGSC
jgi:hypothetical protein